MIVEHQRNFECTLATIGALSGIPLAEVRDYADSLSEKLLGKSFSSIVDNPRLFWLPVIATAEHFSIPADAVMPPVEFGGVYNSSNKFPFPKTGIGVVTWDIWNFDGELDSRHVTPVEDGIIFDPAISRNSLRNAGESLRKFKARHFSQKLKPYICYVWLKNPV